MKTYTTEEACKLTNISISIMKDLLRSSGHIERRFWPEFPGQGRGTSHKFSESDIVMLRKYKATLLEHQKSLNEMRSIARRRKK